ncbi:MAG: TIGR04283 family arsenosugar biosynthesis glycosyltransferase [Bacteroidota bacterium]
MYYNNLAITTISIIIPTLNEGSGIGTLLKQLHLEKSSGLVLDIIVVDGGSEDDTVAIAKDYGARVLVAPKGRAKQMNYGAQAAEGPLLYFLHADTLPPKGFPEYLRTAILEGNQAGCFRMRFDTRNPVLRAFAWLSRINHILCRGGDQSLFVTKHLFEKSRGFNEAYHIYEDSEFIKRLYQLTAFKVLPYEVVTSARKYRELGWLKVQFHFGMIHLKNWLGAGPEALYSYYKKHLVP